MHECYACACACAPSSSPLRLHDDDDVGGGIGRDGLLLPRPTRIDDSDNDNYNDEEPFPSTNHPILILLFIGWRSVRHDTRVAQNSTKHHRRMIMLLLVVEFLMLPFLLLLPIRGVSSTAQLAARFPTENCKLQWQGSWYWSERATPLAMNSTWLDSLGECMLMNQRNHHYLFHLNSAGGSCYRCVAFFPVHTNILLFKQTGCIRSFTLSEDIDSACRRSFRGDAPMTTLFRANATSERCPFEAPLNFTYVFIDGSCKSRTSGITACANPHRFRFQYQACPELQHTETHADEMECIAKWSSFGVDYFAVRLINSQAPSHSSRFRCIIHEPGGSGGRMGLSADASCNELTGISFASTILNYKQDSPVTSRCHFPSFLVHEHHSEEPRLWKSIVTERSHRFTRDEWMEQWDGQNRSVSVCVDEENLGSAHKFVLHTAHGCTSGYQCVKFIRRKRNIVELVRGKVISNEFEACDYLNSDSVETLLLEGSKAEKCPVKGRHTRTGCTTASIHIGCPFEHSIQLRPFCNSNKTQDLICRGHWTEDDVHYVIAEETDTKKRVCYIYSLLGEGMARIRSFRHIACHPGTPRRSAPQYDFNSSTIDECDPSMSAWEGTNNASKNKFSMLAVILVVLWR